VDTGWEREPTGEQPLSAGNVVVDGPENSVTWAELAEILEDDGTANDGTADDPVSPGGLIGSCVTIFRPTPSE
jgi:hypothetical protein